MLTAEPDGRLDPVLTALVGEATADPATLGLVLHGSRARGTARADSDYDLLWIVTDDEYDAQTAAGAIAERRPGAPGKPDVDTVRQCPRRLAWTATHPGPITATYLTVRIVHDPTGVVAEHIAEIRTAADERARGDAPDIYDRYLIHFARSLKCWRRGDLLAARLNAAAESARYLMRLLFALDGRWAPYADDVGPQLPALDGLLGWPAGTVAAALDDLLSDADPNRQQAVERRVRTATDAAGLSYPHHDEVEALRDWQVRPGPHGHLGHIAAPEVPLGRHREDVDAEHVEL